MGSALSRQEQEPPDDGPYAGHVRILPRTSSIHATRLPGRVNNNSSPSSTDGRRTPDSDRTLVESSSDSDYETDYEDWYDQPARRFEDQSTDENENANNLNLTWECRPCWETHRATYWDTPSHEPWSVNCPRIAMNWMRVERMAYIRQSHHIQLALRISSLPSPEPIELDHLRYLLQPYRYRRCLQSRDLLSYCFCEAKIIPSANPNEAPRFLTHKTYTFERVSGTPTMREIVVYVCDHIGFDRTRRSVWTLQDHLFAEDIACALEEVGIEIEASCPFCRSDFAVLSTGQALEIRVWQDQTVPETGPLRPKRINVSFLDGYDNESAVSDISREPGSVQDMYGE